MPKSGHQNLPPIYGHSPSLLGQALAIVLSFCHPRLVQVSYSDESDFCGQQMLGLAVISALVLDGLKSRISKILQQRLDTTRHDAVLCTNNVYKTHRQKK